MNLKELRFFIVVYIFIIVLGFYSNISFCPFYNLTKNPCPGCGMTQAIRYILVGEWSKALKSHLFSFVVLLIIILGLLSFFSKTIYNFINVILNKKWLWMSVFILMLFYGIIRLILLKMNLELYSKFFLYYDYKTVLELIEEIVQWSKEKFIY